MIAHPAIPHYVGGRPYSALHARGVEDFRPPDCRHDRAIALTASLGWAAFWERVSGALGQHQYSAGTRAQYRTVLRNFYRHARQTPPAGTDAALVDSYLESLTRRHVSWSWLAMNISILRTVFDKLAGYAVTRHLVTPKRAWPLPAILSRREVRAILAAGDTVRDQLILGLLYGCGLKIGELRRLVWSDVMPEDGTLNIRHADSTRILEIPPDLQPVLAYGKARCPADNFIFQGRTSGRALSTRMIELIVRRARDSAGILKPVTAMTLRHTYAVHCLEDGDSIRTIQEALGHQSIKTTMLYNRCILPPGLVSPLDPLKRKARESAQADGETPPPEPEAEAPATERRLFEHPLAVDTLELPFSDQPPDGASSFYRLITTLIRNRFLCRRRATIRAG